MRLFHVTDLGTAIAILNGGFEDRAGRYLTEQTFRGVWLSDSPLGANEGVDGDTVMVVEMDVSAAELTEFEWVESGKGYREWLVPAAVIAKHGTVSMLQKDRAGSS